MSQPTHNLQQPRMVWFAFIPSIFMFVGALFAVHQGQATQAENVAAMGLPLSVMALVAFASMPMLRKKIMGGTQTLPLLSEDPSEDWHHGLDEQGINQVLAITSRRHQTGMMVGLAMCEAVALFGFTLGFVAKMPIIILPFAGLSLAGIVWQMPTQRMMDIIAENAADQIRAATNA